MCKLNYFKILQKHFSYQISKYGQQYKNMLKAKSVGTLLERFSKINDVFVF